MKRPLQNVNANLQRRLLSVLVSTFSEDVAFTEIVMPCGVHIYASVDVATPSPAPLVQVGGRTLYCHQGSANQLHYLGYFEAGQTLTPAGSAPGQVTIYGRGNFAVPTKIAGSAVWSDSPWRQAGDWGAGA